MKTNFVPDYLRARDPFVSGTLRAGWYLDSYVVWSEGIPIASCHNGEWLVNMESKGGMRGRHRNLIIRSFEGRPYRALVQKIPEKLS